MICYLAQPLLLELRIALGNLTLAALLIAMGPSLGNELIENHTIAPHTSGTSITEPFFGELNRVARLPIAYVLNSHGAGKANAFAARQLSHIAADGHSLSRELLAPLRC